MVHIKQQSLQLYISMKYTTCSESSYGVGLDGLDFTGKQHVPSCSSLLLKQLARVCVIRIQDLHTSVRHVGFHFRCWVCLEFWKCNSYSRGHFCSIFIICDPPRLCAMALAAHSLSCVLVHAREGHRSFLRFFSFSVRL